MPRLLPLVASVCSLVACSQATSEDFFIFDDDNTIDVTPQQYEQLWDSWDDFHELNKLIDRNQRKLVELEFKRDVRTEALLTREQQVELAQQRKEARDKVVVERSKFLREFAFLSTIIAKGEKFVLLEGLPRISGKDSERIKAKLDEIKAQKNTVEVGGWFFYSESLEVTPSIEHHLRSTLLDHSDFEPYAPKFCGGFHPDFCIQWEHDKKTYYGLVCLTCWEVQYILPQGQTTFDCSPRAWKRLVQVALHTFKRHRDIVEKLDRRFDRETDDE